MECVVFTHTDLQMPSSGFLPMSSCDGHYSGPSFRSESGSSERVGERILYLSIKGYNYLIFNYFIDMFLYTDRTLTEN